MNIYLYTRVSTVQQNDGLDAQEATCRSFLGNLLGQEAWRKRFQSVTTASGQLTVNVVREQVSGSVAFPKRPQGAALLAKLRKGDHLCFAKLDRAFRSARDCHNTLAELKTLGVSTSICDLPDGADVTGNGIAALLIGIMASVAEWERERIGERTRDTKRVAKDQGRYLGGKIPWDKTVVDGKLVDDDSKRIVVRKLREWRSEAVPLRECQARIKKNYKTSLSLDAIRRMTDGQATEAARKRGRRKRQ
ncbi:MAG: recombinase family protein [Acidobacteria bacterium]|nr:recombinase family protein [Acidobacteriota bacterium]